MNTSVPARSASNISKSVHPRCVVCGSQNLSGLHLKFKSIDEKTVQASFNCDESFQGYPGILHGGVICSILDGAMGNCMFALSKATVTIEMTTRFRYPVLIGEDATVSATVTRLSHPLYLLEAKILQAGQVKATAKGKYYHQPKYTELMKCKK